MAIVKKEVDYAIRIVAYLIGKRSLVKTEEISSKLFISLPNTVKILHKLAKRGIIKTKTGKNGGNLLEQHVVNLSIFDIVKCISFDFDVNVCVNVPDSCKLNPICNITHFFADIQYDVVNRLKKAKIKDFIFDDDALNKIGGTYE